MSDELERVPEETAIVAKQDALLERVLTGGNIEVLKEYIALRNAEEERQAKRLFDDHFARLRAELPAVVKSRANDFLKSKYAPLEVLQRACDPTIFSHGFSYSWREEAIPEGKRVYLDISGYGYTKTNYFDAPQIEPVKNRDGGNVQNLLQVRGVMSSYGRRYTFISGFGIIIEGEDSDGQITDDIDMLAMDLREMLKMKDGTGKLLLDQNAYEIIKKELDKDSPDPKRLKAFYKRAKAIIGGRK